MRIYIMGRYLSKEPVTIERDVTFLRVVDLLELENHHIVHKWWVNPYGPTRSQLWAGIQRCEALVVTQGYMANDPNGLATRYMAVGMALAFQKPVYILTAHPVLMPSVLKEHVVRDITTLLTELRNLESQTTNLSLQGACSSGSSSLVEDS